MNQERSAVQLLLDASVKYSIPVPIVTARLELRPFRESDVDGIARLLADHEATKFIGSVKSRDAAADSVRVMRDAFTARGWGTLAVVPRGKQGCVGYCGVRPLPHTAEVEVAFALQQSCWNLGYATEAATASIDTAFNYLGIKSIVATVYPENKASLRVLAKLGMTFEAEVFGHWPMTTALLFRIGREAWHARVGNSQLGISS
jgi:[ribosomal protein S5]-alanine N-acetyltransferase